MVLVGGRDKEESTLSEVQLRERAAGRSNYLLDYDLTDGSNGPVREVVCAIDEKSSYQNGGVAPLGQNSINHRLCASCGRVDPYCDRGVGSCYVVEGVYVQLKEVSTVHPQPDKIAIGKDAESAAS